MGVVEYEVVRDTVAVDSGICFLLIARALEMFAQSAVPFPQRALLALW